MALPLYLALTAAEFARCSAPPQHIAWMACHFSPYGTGLTNLPPALPDRAMLIVNDRTPIHGHDQDAILEQLKPLPFSCALLDFQRPDFPETAALACYLVENLERPVAVSELYAKALDCPVFLPPVPPDVTLGEYIAPWQGREIWLEADLGGICYTVTEKGAEASPMRHHPAPMHRDDKYLCHYRIDTAPDHVDFTLFRTREDLDELLQLSERMGITRAVGLWQELGQ